MGLVDEILVDMRNGLPWSEILRKYRGKSQMYEAYRIFSGEMADKLQRVKDDFVAVQTSLDDAKTDCDLVADEKSLLSGAVADLMAEKQRLENKLGELRAEVTEFETRVAELESRGYSSEIVSKIANIEKRSGKELLAQIKTVEEHNKIVNDLSKRKKEKKLLELDISTKQRMKESLEADVRTLNQQYDELRVRSITYSDAVSVTEDLLKEGFSVEDLQSLRYGLKALQIKGDLSNSIKRFVDRLVKAKSLYGLETAIKKRREELAEINAEVEVFSSKRDVLINGVLERVDRVADIAEKRIQGFSQLTREEIEQTAKKHSSFLEEQKSGFQQFAQSLKKDVADYGIQKELMGALKENVKCGQAFWGLMTQDESLAALDSSVIAAVTDRVAFWTKRHFRDRWTPGQKMALDAGIIPFGSYDISALLEGVAEAIRSNKMGSKVGAS